MWISGCPLLSAHLLFDWMTLCLQVRTHEECSTSRAHCKQYGVVGACVWLCVRSVSIKMSKQAFNQIKSTMKWRGPAMKTHKNRRKSCKLWDRSNTLIFFKKTNKNKRLKKTMQVIHTCTNCSPLHLTLGKNWIKSFKASKWENSSRKWGRGNETGQFKSYEPQKMWNQSVKSR